MLNTHFFSFGMLKNLPTKSNKLKSFTKHTLDKDMLYEAQFSKDRIGDATITPNLIGITVFDSPFKDNKLEIYNLKTKSKKPKNPIFLTKNVQRHLLRNHFLALLREPQKKSDDRWEDLPHSFEIYDLEEKKKLILKASLLKPVIEKSEFTFTRDGKKIFFQKSSKNNRFICLHNLIRNKCELQIDLPTNEHLNKLSQDENIFITNRYENRPYSGIYQHTFYHIKNKGKPLPIIIDWFKEIPDKNIIIIIVYKNKKSPIQIYNTKKEALTPITLKCKQKPKYYTFSKDGTAITIQSETSVHLYKLTDDLKLQLIRKSPLPEYRYITEVSNSGNIVIIKDTNKFDRHYIYFFSKKQLTPKILISSHFKPSNGDSPYTLSNDEKKIAINSKDNGFQVYDISDNHITPIWNKPLLNVEMFTMSPDFKHVAISDSRYLKRIDKNGYSGASLIYETQLYHVTQEEPAPLLDEPLRSFYEIKCDFNSQSNIFILRSRRDIQLYNLETHELHTIHDAASYELIKNGDYILLYFERKIKTLKLPASRSKKMLQDKKIILQDQKERTTFLKENSDLFACKTIQLPNKKIAVLVLAALLIG